MPALNAPTQTNPPFTTPPTWPFSTTAIWWEADYRLRLLEAAIIYAWANGLPPSGPGTGAGGDLSGVYPNPTVVKINGQPVSATIPALNQTLVWNGTSWTPTTMASSFPPSGAATGDLSGNYPAPTVKAIQGQAVSSAAPTLNQVLEWNGTNWIATSLVGYSPPQSPPPTGFNSFTDAGGEVWVSRNGSAWKKARDALHARYHRNAAWTSATSYTTLAFDTADYDSYALYNTGTGIWTVPLAGIWSCIAIYSVNISAVNQSLSGIINSAGQIYSQVNAVIPVGAGSIIIVPNTIRLAAVNDTFTPQYACSTAGLTGLTGFQFSSTLDYLGTG